MYFVQLCPYIIPNDSSKVQTREIHKLTQGIILFGCLSLQAECVWCLWNPLLVIVCPYWQIENYGEQSGCEEDNYYVF